MMKRLALAVAFVLGGWLLAWGSRGCWTTARHPASATLDGLAACGAAALAWCCIGWLAVLALLTLAGAFPSAAGSLAHRITVRMAPPAVRRLVAAALGLAAVTAPAALGPGAASATPARPAIAAAVLAEPRVAPAEIDPVPPLARGLDAALDAAALDARGLDRPAGLRWTPDRPAAPPARHADVGLVASSPSRPTAARHDASIVVRRGDTLWDISARALGPDAHDSEIARAWPRWYGANLDAIGSDPGLLVPGMLLRPPI